jgi:hypothetical protein
LAANESLAVSSASVRAGIGRSPQASRRTRGVLAR